mgnify:CR=1 FL=1
MIAHLIETIRNTSAFMLRLLDDLLDVAAIEAGKLDEWSVAFARDRSSAR